MQVIVNVRRKEMRGFRLLGISFASLVLLIALAARDLASGAYGGFGAVLWAWPIIFLLSLIVAVLFNPGASGR